jgi:ankyrin repeat protein
MNLLDKLADGRTDLVFDLLREGYDARSTDENGVSMVKWCAYYGDLSAIKYLLQQGASLSDLGENFDLNGAAFHGHWQLCQFLLEQGADPNYPLPDSGETPLHGALSKAGRPAYNIVVKLLLSYGADPNRKTIPGRETGDFMRDAFTKGETPLHRAAAFANAECIELLLKAGADKEIKDANGDSPLSWASWHLRTGKILSLLCFGEYSIHPDRVKNAVSDHGDGWGNGMEIYLLGKAHIT